MRRRDFLALLGTAPLAASRLSSAQPTGKRPNVVLVMTDDQGFGDMSCHGNTHLKTPNIDRIAAEGVEFTEFFVCPVSAPTRASLMTGRYNYRTGVVDTYLGRAMMHADEVTLAEILGKAGYATGIFGKWHLGDNYPLRPVDQGFQEALVHKGGGLCQPAGPPGNSYFDPILQHNGKAEKHEGYCTDIFADAAIRFIEANRERPFFVYLPTNAPHGPFLIADEYWKPYKAKGLDDRTAKVYGMVKNIDENLGKLLDRLAELDLERDTIVIFLTDNGPNGRRYNCGLRAHKGSVYEGGIRTAFFCRWPARLKAGKKVDRIAAHIDMLPTLCAACGADLPQDTTIDGRNLLPLMEGTAEQWPDRTLFFQWHRGDEPVPFRKAAVRTEEWKLVNGKELYHIPDDPGEKKNVADQHPKVVERLRKAYQAWFKDVSATRGYAPPRIHLGTPHENPVTLTRQDWRGPRAGWGGKALGHWEVKVAQAGVYDIRLRFRRLRQDGEATLKFGDLQRTQAIEKGATQCTFEGVKLPAGPGRLEAWITGALPEADATVGVNYVDVELKAELLTAP
jgi:arylsulfatase A-like enzyme